MIIKQLAIDTVRCASTVVYTNSSDKCYQYATVALCLQHLMVTPLTTYESRSNTWECARIPKLEVLDPCYGSC